MIDPCKHYQPMKEMPRMVLKGEAITTLPDDLYIPPDALAVFLEAFEGPLDLLLYLIKKQNIDILDIPIAEITKQYMTYIDLMKELQLELAAEYLLMAAMLAEIKSRMLLPRPIESEDEEDPRAELVRRLQEYERYKQAAENLDALPRQGRDTFVAQAELTKEEVEKKPLPNITLKELLLAFHEVLKTATLREHHHVAREVISVRERMTHILTCLKTHEFVVFSALFNPNEGRMGVVVTFIAILELLKESAVGIVQADAYAPIHLKAIG